MKIKPLVYHSYIAMIEDSVGSRMWQRNYALVDGKKTDVTNRGELSCAYYVSTILATFRLIENHHLLVSSLLADMNRSGWKEVKRPEVGDVILWGPKNNSSGGEEHNHVGFYMGGRKAIANNYVRSKPGKAKIEVIDFEYRGHPDGARPIIGFYRYRGSNLFNKS